WRAGTILAFDSMLTTAGSTFLTTSRYDVSSLGMAGTAGACPFSSGPARKTPTSPPSTRQQTIREQRFMVDRPPEKQPKGSQVVKRLGDSTLSPNLLLPNH